MLYKIHVVIVYQTCAYALFSDKTQSMVIFSFFLIKTGQFQEQASLSNYQRVTIVIKEDNINSKVSLLKPLKIKPLLLLSHFSRSKMHCFKQGRFK